MISRNRLRLARADAEAFSAGFSAALAGQDRGACPHPEHTSTRVWWLSGHGDGRRDRERAGDLAQKVRGAHGGQLGFSGFERALRCRVSRVSAAEVRLAWQVYSGIAAQGRSAA